MNALDKTVSMHPAMSRVINAQLATHPVDFDVERGPVPVATPNLHSRRGSDNILRQIELLQLTVQLLISRGHTVLGAKLDASMPTVHIRRCSLCDSVPAAWYRTEVHGNKRTTTWQWLFGGCRVVWIETEAKPS